MLAWVQFNQDNMTRRVGRGFLGRVRDFSTSGSLLVVKSLARLQSIPPVFF